MEASKFLSAYFWMWVPIDSAEDTYDMSRHQKAVLINRGAQNQKHYMYVLKITKKATGRLLIM